MNYDEASAIMEKYNELHELAVKYAEAHAPPIHYGRAWSFQRVFWEDGSFTAEWSNYMGCGDYDYDKTYFTLEQLLENQS